MPHRLLRAVFTFVFPGGLLFIAVRSGVRLVFFQYTNAAVAREPDLRQSSVDDLAAGTRYCLCLADHLRCKHVSAAAQFSGILSCEGNSHWHPPPGSSAHVSVPAS